MITDGEIFKTVAENTLNSLLDCIDDALGDVFDVDSKCGEFWESSLKTVLNTSST